MQPLSRNQRPDLPTALMNMSLALRLPWKMHLCRSSSNAPRLPSFLDMLSKSGPSMRCFSHFDFEMCFAPHPSALFRPPTSISAPKLRCFYKCNPSQEINAWTSQQLWWTCLLYCACHGKCIFADLLQMPHACHHFWTCCKTLTLCSLLALAPATPNDIWTSKSGPSMRCFSHFDFEMCFAPQRSALFRQRNFYKCSEAEVLLAFSLANVLRATTACTFSTSQLQLDDGWPESVQEQGLLLLVWRHNITNNILKMCYRQSRRGVSRQNSRSARR